MSSEGSDPNSPSLKKKGVEGPAPKALPEDTTLNEDGMPLNPSDQAVQFIPAGQDPANGDAKVEIGDSAGHPKFVGLGKEELMKFANDPFWVRLRWFLFILFWIVWLAMLVGAVVIILRAPKCSDKLIGPTDGPYVQVNVKDISTNQKLDGISDSAVENLQNLGVNAIIISQILETDPGARNPEQVTNFKAIDVLYGSLEALKGAIQKLHDKSIKVLLQIVPNHSSIKHEWFTNRSLVSDYYVTKDANDESSWPSQVSPGEPGSAWSLIPPDNQPEPSQNKSYLHQFDSSTADLNFRNPNVVKEMNSVLQFWYEAGVDGFLLSKVSHLLENVKDLNNNKSLINQANADIVKRLIDSSSWGEAVLSNRSAPYALIEVTNLPLDKAIPYYTDRISVVNTELADLKGNVSVADVKNIIEQAAAKISKNTVVWKLPRANDPRSQVLALVAATLRGQVALSVADLGGNINSPPPFYKDLLAAVKALNQSQAGGGSTSVNSPADGILVIKRENEKEFIVAINLGSETRTADIANEKEEREATVLAATSNAGEKLTKGSAIGAPAGTISLPPNSGVILEIKKTE